MALVLTNPEIARVLDPTAVIDALDDAYRAYAGGIGVSVPRTDAQGAPGENGATYQLGTVVGVTGGRYAALRIKSDMVFETTEGGRRRKEKYAGRPGRFLGLILLFDTGTGDLLAILHDGLIQQMRVGADSALGIRYMARRDATRLAILGAGGMAGTHLACISRVRKLDRIRVFSPTAENRARFAADWSARGLPVEAVGSAEEAIDGADIVSCCTNAIGPVLHGPQLSPGQHVTCIGGTLDAGASARIDLALRFGEATVPDELPGWDFDAQCLSFNGGGKAGAGGTRRFAEIPPERLLGFADLLSGRREGRSSASQITFSERGNIHGLQFAAVAGQVYEAAVAQRLGTELPAELFLETVRN